MRPYRGNGRGEAAYAIERLIDVAADELGMDPAHLRRINMIPPEAMPYKTGLVFTYDSGDFANAMDDALEMADYKGVRGAGGLQRRRAASSPVSASRSPSNARPASDSKARRSVSTGPARSHC